MSTSCDLLADAQAYLESDHRRFTRGAWLKHRQHRSKLVVIQDGRNLTKARRYVKNHPTANPQCCAEGAVLLAAARSGASYKDVLAALKALNQAARRLYNRTTVSTNDRLGRKAVLKAFEAARENCN